MARLLSLCLLAPLACTTSSAPAEPAVNPAQGPGSATAAAQADSPAAGAPSAERAPAETAATTPGSATWTDAGGGLSVRLELPTRPPRLGDSVELRLHFRNTGGAPLRIYMIGAEVFRAQQSDLQVFAADDTFIASQPEPHPHGYVVSERDFPEIAPGEDQVHVQTLRLGGPRFAGVTGPLRVRWTYRNNIEAWKGGAQTLDGPTRSLFGGGKIPGIWRGEVAVTATLPLAP